MSAGAARARGATRACFLLLLAGWIGGCASGGGAPDQQPAASDDSAPITNTDPCAMRLHDLSGSLLEFYFHYGELPATLAELSAGMAQLDAATQVPPGICPASQIPYMYDPRGILLPERRSRVVLWDPAPTHSGMRWAVTVEEPPNQEGVLVTKVIALPERFFVLRPAR